METGSKQLLAVIKSCLQLYTLNRKVMYGIILIDITAVLR